jgi:threonine dehydratase
MGPALPTPEQIAAARASLPGVAIRTPLIRLPGTPIHLKLETLQPTGSFKLRGAAAVLGSTSKESVATGIVTASAGNMGQGAAWFAHKLGVPCTVIVPPTAPPAKVTAMEAYGATVLRVTAEQWWQAFIDRRFDGVDGVFIHAFDDPVVMAGNATIALEILEDLPTVTTVVAPWGGGGLACGLASVLTTSPFPTDAESSSARRVLAKPAPSGRRVFAAEVATAAPLVAALAAGKPVEVDFEASFVDGIGSRTVLESMFDRAQMLGIDALVAPVAAVADAVRMLMERVHVVAEGAGATSVAVALAAIEAGANGFGPDDVVVCVVSGGCIGLETIAALLPAAT